MSDAKAVKAVSTERVIAAPADQIFAVLADPRQHAVIDGSGTVRKIRSGPDRLALGARFGVAMHQLVPYPVTNEVVEFEEGRRIAWRHLAHDVWRYELEPRDDATLVRETFDWSHGRGGKVIEMLGIPQKNLASMEKTLERLAAHVETGGAAS
ncbi:MAG: hypothetical protein QOH10_2456 [Actinomycetota bacterium]|jgi:uncharacterized protein YndB with AHSA1/START domain|nr:hypothetical protein [Actinomycetota bacterium]